MHSFSTFFKKFCSLIYCGRSEVIYKIKKTNSVTFQQFHCLTLDVANTGNNGAGNGSSISVDSCLNTYFTEEVK